MNTKSTSTGEIEFDRSLAWNLNKLGVKHYQVTSAKNAGKRLWYGKDGEFLGEFDAHEGWRLLRHYNLCGRLGLAIKMVSETPASYSE